MPECRFERIAERCSGCLYFSLPLVGEGRGGGAISRGSRIIQENRPSSTFLPALSCRPACLPILEFLESRCCESEPGCRGTSAPVAVSPGADCTPSADRSMCCPGSRCGFGRERRCAAR